MWVRDGHEAADALKNDLNEADIKVVEKP